MNPLKAFHVGLFYEICLTIHGNNDLGKKFLEAIGINKAFIKTLHKDVRGAILHKKVHESLTGHFTTITQHANSLPNKIATIQNYMQRLRAENPFLPTTAGGAISSIHASRTAPPRTTTTTSSSRSTSSEEKMKSQSLGEIELDSKPKYHSNFFTANLHGHENFV